MEGFPSPSKPSQAPGQPEESPRERLERAIQDLEGRIAILKAHAEALASRYDQRRQHAEQISLHAPDPDIAAHWREITEGIDERLQESRQDLARSCERLWEQLQQLYAAYAQLLKEEAAAAQRGLEEEIARLKQQLKEAERLLLKDPLTNLWNREGAALLWNVIERFMTARIREKHEEGKVCEFVRELEEGKEARPIFFAFDLDGFKLLNDHLGHAVGDKVLVEFANELRRVFRRESDIVVHPDARNREGVYGAQAKGMLKGTEEDSSAARVGGDEFYAFVLTKPEWSQKEVREIRATLAKTLDDMQQRPSQSDAKAEPQAPKAKDEQQQKREEILGAFGVSVGEVDLYLLAKEVVALRLHTSPDQLNLDDPRVADEVLVVLEALLAHNPFQPSREERPPLCDVPFVENVAEYLRAASKELRKTIRRWEALERKKKSGGRSVGKQEEEELEALRKWLPEFVREQFGDGTSKILQETGLSSVADLVRGTLEEAMRFVVAKRQARGESMTLEEYRKQLFQLFARPPEEFQLAQTGVELPGR